MKTLCVATLEFKALCLRVVERLVTQLQYWESPDQELKESAVVSFASILFRVCTLLFEIQKQHKSLSRFIGSRAIANRIQDIHEEMNQFAELHGQAPDSQLCEEQLHEGCLEIQLRLEELANTDNTLKVGFSTLAKLFQGAILLQNEANLHEKEGNHDIRDSVQRVLDCYLKVNTMEVPPVPEWFVFRDDVELQSWSELPSGNDFTVYKGKWRKSDVVIERSDLLSPIGNFEQAASTWYSLSHPNVVGLFGACHVKFHRFFVVDSWKYLYEAARGLEYLHNQRVVHGDLRREHILIGSDGVTRLHGIGSAPFNVRNDDQHKYSWVAPEIARRKSSATAASDVYSFGMCIWEAVTLEFPWKDTSSREIEVNLLQGELPHHPSNMDDAAWDLVTKMCAANPGARMTLNRVITRLKQLELNQRSTLGEPQADTETSDSNEDRCEGLESHIFAELDGSTIQDTFKRIQAKRELLSENQWMFKTALPAFDFIFDLLRERHQVPRDVEVVSFCRVLYDFEQLLRLARARSCKVAETHGVAYTKLDRLLDLLDVRDTDPIRLWRHDDSHAGLGNQPPYIGFANTSNNSEKEERGGNKESSTVSVELVDPSAASHDSWTQQGLAAVSEPSSLPWYRSLKDLVFSESQKIGKGSFGFVCKGLWLDAPVVIKFMGYDGDAKAVSTDLLLHEFYGACHVDKRYFVCEYASNGELKDFLRKPGNEYLLWQKMHEAALGLEYLHSQNVAHNDLKCDNIMVGMDGKAKLIDFGLSTLLGEAEIKIDVKKMGAVNWRSPEYLAGDRPSSASDAFSFAMCIIEVVSGEIPWRKGMLSVAIRYQWRKGNGLYLPDSMSAKQKNLIHLMTKQVPSKREPLRRVVKKLNEFAQEALAERAL